MTTAAMATVSTIISVVVTVVVIVLIVKCLRKVKMPDINLHLPKYQTSGALQAEPPRAFPDSNDGGGETTIGQFINDMAREKPMRFTAQQLAYFTGNYMTKLGSGGFGIVYKGQLPDGMLVAVKVLNKSLDKRAGQQFMAEVATIGRLGQEGERSALSTTYLPVVEIKYKKERLLGIKNNGSARGESHSIDISICLEDHV